MEGGCDDGGGMVVVVVRVGRCYFRLVFLVAVGGIEAGCDDGGGGMVMVVCVRRCYFRPVFLAWGAMERHGNKIDRRGPSCGGG